MTNEKLEAKLKQADEETMKGNYDTAERFAQEVLTELESPSISLEARDLVERLRANAMLVLGAVSWRRSNYTTALEYLNAALILSEKTDDKAGVATHLGEIGNVGRR